MDQGSSLNFDFNSQAGVMSLLAAIRSSALSPVEKNELRDLVFLYTNGGGDVSVRIALEQKLIAHKIQTATGPVTTAPVNPAPVLSFGSSRPAPVFTDVPSQTPVAYSTPAPMPNPAPAPVQAPVVAPAPQPVYAQPVPIAQVPVQQPPVAYPAPAPVVAPAPQPVYAQPVPIAQVPVQQPPVAYPAPAPVVAPAPQPVYAQPQPVAYSAPAPLPVAQVAVPSPVPAAPIPSVAPVQAGVNYLDRIREIKSAVNSKVGNPVNLVDINNEVGREYMNALLDAMKRLSGGASSQIEVAMQRLESAYQAVEVAVAAHNQSKATSAPEPVAESSVSEPAPIAPTPSSTMESPVQPAGSPIVGSWSQPESEKVKTDQVSESEPVFINKPPLSTFELSPEEEKISGFNAPSAPEPLASSALPTQTPVPTAVTSLANEQRVRTPGDLPSADSITTSTSGDPLKTKEIDDGLEQLLSDWSLFKKSGLFGTGPRGREHPLFKKIAGLQIPLVLAGRFEGSTQDIKQSITDYMNGWRYEQGIIYEQGETFEHYLRRVIKQILDLQKKSANQHNVEMLEHHAYLCRVDEVVPSVINDFVKSLDITEVVYLEIDSFGIDDVRSLTEKAFIRPIVGDRQVLVVCLKSITIEAQQALLKILEEPPVSVVFVFCIPKSLFILPTVLSRFFQKRIDLVSGKKDLTAFLNFKSLSVAERITEISNRITKKDTAWIDEIKFGLLEMLTNESRINSQKKLSQLYFIVEHLQTRGASNKLLLEELALTMD